MHNFLLANFLLINFMLSWWNMTKVLLPTIGCTLFVFPGILAYDKLIETLTENSLVKGIKQASPLSQTKMLEGFHSALNYFAPKMIAYSYVGMYCR